MYINTITRYDYLKNTITKALTDDELEWLLANGYYNDNGNWIDTATWKDAP